MNCVIRFTRHAEQKFLVLARHRFRVTRDLVIQTIEEPELVDTSRLPILIAQGQLDAMHVLRVVYREEDDGQVIITFYPGRRSQYEN